jgi:hypothetical protein
MLEEGKFKIILPVKLNFKKARIKNAKNKKKEDIKNKLISLLFPKKNFFLNLSPFILLIDYIKI